MKNGISIYALSYLDRWDGSGLKWGKGQWHRHVLRQEDENEIWVSTKGPCCGSWIRHTNREKGGIFASENHVLLRQSCWKQCGKSHWQLYTVSIFNWICCGTEPHTIQNSLNSFSNGFILFQQPHSPATPQLGLFNSHARSWQAHQQGTSQLQLHRALSLLPWLGCTAGRISRFLLPGQLQVIFRALWSCPINRKFFKKSQLAPSPVFILKLYLPVIFLSNFKSKPVKIIFGNINLFLYTVNKKCRNSVNPLMPFKISPEALLPVTPSSSSWAVALGHQPLACQTATFSVQIHFKTWNSNANSNKGCVCKRLVFECFPHIHLHFLPFLTLWSAVGCLPHREVIIH